MLPGQERNHLINRVLGEFLLLKDPLERVLEVLASQSFQHVLDLSFECRRISSAEVSFDSIEIRPYADDHQVTGICESSTVELQRK